MDKFIRVDFHCHSIYSPDGFGKPSQIIDVAHRKGIDRLAITDHNAIRGALIAKEIDPQMVIIGEEIRTNKGELLAFYIQEELPSGLPYLEVIEKLKEQNAFICVPHPFDKYRSGWSLKDLELLIPMIDAIEVFNARCILSQFNQSAINFARQHKLAEIAGSDAHHPIEIGHGMIELPSFSNADELRNVICEGRLIGKKSPVWYHLISTYASLYKKISA